MKISDHQLTGMLASTLGAPGDLNTPELVIEWAETYCEALTAPFSLRDVRIVYERIPVVNGAFKPTNGQLLVKYLMEEENTVLLVPDLYHAGKEALFFAAICDHDTATQWVRRINCRNQTQLVIGARQNRMVIAASLQAFIN